jgi:AhpD family alkylhydroperoxidase
VSGLIPEAYEAVAELDSRLSEFGIDGALRELVNIRAFQINACAYRIDSSAARLRHPRAGRCQGEGREGVRREELGESTRGRRGDNARIRIAVATRMVLRRAPCQRATYPLFATCSYLDALARRFRYTKEEFSDLEGEGGAMDHWADPSAWREHRRELLRETLERQLEREAHKIREAFAHSKKRPEAADVRWGLPEDETKVAELIELNSMPRWVAFEELFIVAERDGQVLAAARYWTEPKRLVLGLLLADPCAEERRLTVDLYAGERRLALELGANDISARTDGCHAAYPCEAGYHRWDGGWRMDLSQPVKRRDRLPAVGRRRSIALVGAFLAALRLPKRWSRRPSI